VHPTGGSLRVFRQFAWLRVGSGKVALSRPTHQRVTPAVSLQSASRVKMVNQHNKFNTKPVLQITTIWTLCFFFGPLAGWKIGEMLRSAIPSFAATRSVIDILVGLIIAEIMSGIFSAMILRNKLPGIRLQHVIFIALGWGLSGLILSYTFYVLALFPN